MNNSSTSSDYINAKESFIKWQGNINESVEGYMLRQRKAELRELVKRVIKNELSTYDQLIVRLRWYENYSTGEIAEKLGVDRSTVARHIEKINSIIYDKLKYAIEYRYGKDYSKAAEMIIKSSDAYACTVDAKEISDRLVNLRSRQCLSTGEVSSLTAIEEKRLRELEKQGNKMSVTELKKLCTFYRCSSDYLLFGKTEGGLAYGKFAQ
ncbi:MAG: sigma-70 family RNA polymerase sigma factor [Clostridia bacterium]|nr:sigma-70 family RNA polymerase sigma factor [Clostridia bacterium]